MSINSIFRKNRSRLPYQLINIGVLSLFLFGVRIVEEPSIVLPQIMMLFIIVVAVFVRQFTLNTTVLWIISALLIHGIIGVLMGTTSALLVTENFLRLLIFYLAFSCILVDNPEYVQRALRFYLTVGTWVSAIGLIALLAFVAGVTFAYDFSWFLNNWSHIPWGGHLGLPRAQSIFAEPAHAVYVLGPATFFAVGRLLGSHANFITYRSSITILAFIFMTNSTTAYATLPFALLFNLRPSFKQFLLGIAASSALAVLITFTNDLNFEQNFRKVELVLEMIRDDGQTVGVSGSSYASYVGSVIATEIFRDTGGLGGGLGSFEFSFNQVIGSLKIAEGNMANYQSGGSLMARSMAELGLFGVGLWLVALSMALRGWFKFEEPYRAIHLAMFVGFLPFFFRFGSYDSLGFAFFLTVFVVNAQHASLRRQATKRRSWPAYIRPTP